jgi:hypothetical protein
MVNAIENLENENLTLLKAQSETEKHVTGLQDKILKY